MGCVASKADLSDRQANVFHVMNVDDLGNRHSPGQLEITEAELVLHQKGKEAVRWPLRSLRCYGFDAEVFTFESGRRCPTGHGIYAFKCKRAEQLFNLLQGYVQMRNEDASSRDSASLPVGLSGTYMPNSTSRNWMSADSTPAAADNNGYLDPVSSSSTRPGRGSLSLPHASNVIRSIPISPTGSLPASSYYANEEVFMAAEHNSEWEEPLPVNNGYVNLPQNKGEVEAASHLYMNVIPESSKEALPSPRNEEVTCCEKKKEDEEEEEEEEVDTVNGQVRQVNYVLLDLDHGSDSNSQTLPTSPLGSVSSCPNSPRRASEGYVTIDFDKTAALSNSANPSVDHDEGCRKTRHNSAMNDIVLSRNNSSMSD